LFANHCPPRPFSCNAAVKTPAAEALPLVDKEYKGAFKVYSICKCGLGIHNAILVGNEDDRLIPLQREKRGRVDSTRQKASWIPS
jgi:hypothetical protein